MSRPSERQQNDADPSGRPTTDQRHPSPPPSPPHEQCLDYFGDGSGDSSPTQLCAAARKTDITVRLRSLRLRHCCERNALSAIRNEVLDKVLAGGDECLEHLRDLQKADELADRVTCELNRILVRYDCRQLYSIKHGCLDCKVSDNWRWLHIRDCKTGFTNFENQDRKSRF